MTARKVEPSRTCSMTAAVQEKDDKLLTTKLPVLMRSWLGSSQPKGQSSSHIHQKKGCITLHLLLLVSLDKCPQLVSRHSPRNLSHRLHKQYSHIVSSSSSQLSYTELLVKISLLQRLHMMKCYMYVNTFIRLSVNKAMWLLWGTLPVLQYTTNILQSHH